MRAQQVIRGKRLGSIQDGAFRDEGSARCCSSQSVLTAWSASQGHDMGVCGLAAAGAVKAMSPGTADGGCACALAAVVHSSRGARSAIQHRPGWTLKRSPAPRRLQPRQAGAGVWSALALHWHCTGTKAAAILSPPPPVSLFPQSLSLFPSLRQLSCTCTTQRVPCVALPIAAFPARLPLPRPSSFKLPPCALLNRIRLLLHRLPAARCTLGTSRLARSCCCSRRALRCQCALLSHPSLPKFPPRPAEPSLARQSRLLACAPEQVRSSCSPAAPCHRALPSQSPCTCIPCSPQPKGSAPASSLVSFCPQARLLFPIHRPGPNPTPARSQLH